jgi:hypothetical protein
VRDKPKKGEKYYGIGRPGIPIMVEINKDLWLYYESAVVAAEAIKAMTGTSTKASTIATSINIATKLGRKVHGFNVRKANEKEIQKYGDSDE